MAKAYECELNIPLDSVMSTIRSIPSGFVVNNGKRYRYELSDKHPAFSKLNNSTCLIKFDIYRYSFLDNSLFGSVEIQVLNGEESVTIISFEMSNYNQSVLSIAKSIILDKLKETSLYRINVETPQAVLDELPDGRAFEFYLADVLRKNGYDKVSVTSGSGDYGIDIIAEKESVKFAIQCKYYNSPVNNSAVQQASSGRDFYNCHVAVVATNNIFTRSAIETAEKTNVVLWDREKILAMSNF